jgi:hypothetical protein
VLLLEVLLKAANPTPRLEGRHKLRRAAVAATVLGICTHLNACRHLQR